MIGVSGNTMLKTQVIKGIPEYEICKSREPGLGALKKSGKSI